MNRVKNKVYIDTLGCPKNFSDSESAAAALSAAGFVMTDKPETADFIMVNTCGFIEDAKRESVEHIFDMSRVLRKGAKLVVSGCLSQRYADELFLEMPEADCFIGVNQYDELPEILDSLGEDRQVHYADCGKGALPRQARVPGNNPYSATLKIAEGCSNACSYCIIPAIRGGYRSKLLEDALAEAMELAEAGTKELILIAQDLTYYGIDIYGKPMLAELLRRLCRIDGIRWIRLMYCYDENITDEFIEVMKNEDKICKYIDIPIQHASDRILHMMNRKSDFSGIQEKLKHLRTAMPGIRIRTTLMVGFPGETDEDYEALCDMVAREKFDRLGVFAYSQEEGTSAAAIEEQIPDDVKRMRLDNIMRMQMEISRENNRLLIDSILECIVDEAGVDGSYVGRTRFDAPEIDGSVIFISEKMLEPGDLIDVRITDSFDYDLTGVAICRKE